MQETPADEEVKPEDFLKATEDVHVAMWSAEKLCSDNRNNHFSMRIFINSKAI